MTPADLTRLATVGHVSPDAVASVCADLALAAAGVHPYGGHVAEVYAYRLDRARPALDSGLDDGERAERARATHAALSAILTALADRLPEGWRIEVDGAPFGEWRGEYGSAHRYHVAILPPEVAA